MENRELISILPKLISNSYQQGFIEALEMMEKIPPVSYNQAEKIFGSRAMKEWTKDMKLVRSGAGKNTPYLFNLSDLIRKNSELASLKFINVL